MNTADFEARIVGQRWEMPECYDDADARAEGWVLSERDDGTLEIQCYDEGTAFKNDFEAVAHVALRARLGSAMHLAALLAHVGVGSDL